MAPSKGAALPKNSEADVSDTRKAYSRIMLMPAVTHAAVTQVFAQSSGTEKLDQQAIFDGIMEKAKAVVEGDMSSSERMLVAQATTLNAVCVDLFLRAHANLHERVNYGETYMKLALKAQNQCRMTLETLAAIKNPPVVFARQANFANGPQQVNNGMPARVAKNEASPNELLEEKHDASERLDCGAPDQAIGGDPAMATVGEINRAAKR